jgi:hypothetical protein
MSEQGIRDPVVTAHESTTYTTVSALCYQNCNYKGTKSSGTLNTNR